MSLPRRLLLSPRAAADLEDIADYVAREVQGRYLVLYRDIPGENAVRVERVLHGARKLPGLF